jgi:hypothetical protein
MLSVSASPTTEALSPDEPVLVPVPVPVPVKDRWPLRLSSFAGEASLYFL